MIYSFKNDYSEGAHPRILERLVTTNAEQTVGYGVDHYSEAAKERIKEVVGNPASCVHLLVGGTQTNLTAIAAFLRGHEAVIAATTGHVAIHETGAIEATGHKVVTIAGEEGKLRPQDVIDVLAHHTDEHMVRPRLVYLSNATEVGTIYTKAELVALYEVCQEHNLYLYLDGARLGCALMAEGNDMTLQDLGRYTDAFYIGGTKNGALLGEALVINNPVLQEDFRYHIKQKGGLLAKGRLIGLQFLVLFEGNLFFEIGKHANEMAHLLKQGLDELGVPFLVDSPTNQIFAIFNNEKIEKLSENYAFEKWENLDENHTVIRFVTSWATTREAVEGFVKAVANL